MKDSSSSHVSASTDGDGISSSILLPIYGKQKPANWKAPEFSPQRESDAAEKKAKELADLRLAFENLENADIFPDRPQPVIAASKGIISAFCSLLNVSRTNHLL